ncbi:2-dehydropantoate 2-reductase [Paenibacillus qinlingensis]|uniref:2-dehydropantoate 2-reductase n=1 Tax=Paenibacillus qinlingensis TaxID=1837343 RepID=A0ABU1NV90_9BACL|nr:2-dehydropantoate 2-reductase [Paenibacillus qinlingensis]MDR6551360.1 2-dehydropantoate 2-reductase [Paenibacillus qinlingensis]
MHIMVVGAGSLGLLFAAKLASQCSQLTMVTRTTEQASELAEQGIKLEGEASQTAKSTKSIVYSSYLEETREDIIPNERQVDYIFLMVKQTAITDELVTYLRHQMTDQTFLVCFQNGIGHEQKLSQAIAYDKLLFAVTTEGAKRNGLHSVRHTGRGITYFGVIESNKQLTPNNQHIFFVQMLKSAGFRAELSNNMEVRIWSKLVINVVINPLTAILRVPNGDLLRSEWSRSLMQDLYEEALKLANLKRIALPDKLWDTILTVCEETKTNHSSMLQDIEAARQTEIDYLNGRLVKVAEEWDLVLPTHDMVYRMIKAIEN